MVRRFEDLVQGCFVLLGDPEPLVEELDNLADKLGERFDFSLNLDASTSCFGLL